MGARENVRRSPRQGAALALALAAKAHAIVAIHRALAHPSEEITQKTIQAIESREKNTGGIIRSRGDTGDTFESRRGDTGGAVGS